MNNTEINPPPTIGRALAETELLIAFLSTATIGQVITYAELNAACKDDVQLRSTILNTARRVLAKPPHRMVFGTIVGVGIKRLSDDEIPDESDRCVKRARRIAKSGLTKLSCADLAKMSPENKIRAITSKTVLGLFSSSGSRKVRNLAEQKARSDASDLKIGDISSLFGK